MLSCQPTPIFLRRQCIAIIATRKDPARSGDPAATRFQQGAFEQHVVSCITDLLTDEHALRRLANPSDAGSLGALFEPAKGLSESLEQKGLATSALGSLIRAIPVCSDHVQVTLDPAAVGAMGQPMWMIRIPRSARRPFREARLRIDADPRGPNGNPQLVKLRNVSWLSPRIIESIIEGCQPHGITRNRLLATKWPLDWTEQEALLGIAAA